MKFFKSENWSKLTYRDVQKELANPQTNEKYENEEEEADVEEIHEQPKKSK